MENLSKQGLLKDVYHKNKKNKRKNDVKRNVKDKEPVPIEDESSSFIHGYAAFPDDQIEHLDHVDDHTNDYYQWTDDEGETSSAVSCYYGMDESDIGSPVSSHSMHHHEDVLKRTSNIKQQEEPVVYSGPQLLFDTTGDCVF
jgi:hypothetical protein